MAKRIAVALGAGSLWSRGSARNRPSITASTESSSQQTLQSPHECWDSVGEAVFSSATYPDEEASRDTQRLRFLAELAKQGVDLTQYLVARERSQGHEQVVRLETAGGARGGEDTLPAPVPHVHLATTTHN